MKKLQLEKPWEETRELMIELVSELAGEDLNYNEAEEDQLIERVAKKMNRTPDHVRMWIESVSHTTDRAS